MNRFKNLKFKEFDIPHGTDLIKT